jgi:hypothetical protein
MKMCVFCGKRPQVKTMEHVLPTWLIRMTGDPKRTVTFGSYNWKTRQPRSLSFDKFMFPACDACNNGFSGLEDRAKNVVARILKRDSLNSADLDLLLDWLDKVRIGVWLGLMMIEGNPWGIKPKFYIQQRLALHDRSVGFCFVDEREDGINLIGAESPCFAFAPATLVLLINQIGLFNSSAMGLCSRRLGFPFMTEAVVRDDRQVEGKLMEGLERFLTPVERGPQLHNVQFVYQPIFERGLEQEFDEFFDTDYVRSNSLDFRGWSRKRVLAGTLWCIEIQ